MKEIFSVFKFLICVAIKVFSPNMLSPFTHCYPPLYYLSYNKIIMNQSGNNN